MKPIPITLDGRPGRIVAWTVEGRDTFADIDLDSGKKTFCRWPSVRIEAQESKQTCANHACDHAWQSTDDWLIDRCTKCGEERA